MSLVLILIFKIRQSEKKSDPLNCVLWVPFSKPSDFRAFTLFFFSPGGFSEA